MRYFWLSAAFVVTLVASLAQSVLAAELSTADHRYLEEQYGIGQQDEPLSAMTAAEQRELHALIADPKLKDAPAVRHDRVAAFLYDINMRQCERSAASHPGLVCPPLADPALEPGKELADRQCNFCHLFGAGRAPAFRKLAERHWTASGLAEAQQQGHENARRFGRQMSPIALTREQFADLARYIDSLK